MNFARPLFLYAAFFNWFVGGGILIAYRPLFYMTGITPIPENPLFLYLFSGFLLVFGLGYFWASRDFLHNIPVIKLGIIGKLIVFVLVLDHFLAGNISWPFFMLACVDLVYALLFIHALRRLHTSGVKRLQLR